MTNKHTSCCAGLLPTESGRVAFTSDLTIKMCDTSTGNSTSCLAVASACTVTPGPARVACQCAVKSHLSQKVAWYTIGGLPHGRCLTGLASVDSHDLSGALITDSPLSQTLSKIHMFTSDTTLQHTISQGAQGTAEPRPVGNRFMH